MGFPVLILGESGTGKSYSLRNFTNEEVALVNVLGKPLPFFGSDVKPFVTRDFASVRQAVRNAPRRAVVIDDAGYLITDLYMRLSYGEERLRDQFDVYKLIAHEMYGLMNDIMATDEDKIVYVTMHTDTTVSGVTQPLTVGKLLNEKIKIVGMVSTLLLTQVQGGQYQFVTNGVPPAKSAPGLLPERMPNDLKEVDWAIRAAYGLMPLVGGPEGGEA